MGRPTPPVFDLLVLTASSASQAAGYRLELAEHRRRGNLTGIGATLVVSDPLGKRVGSGGSTIVALDHIARRLRATGRGAFARAVAPRRIAIIHCGGDSKRLPAFSAHGKVFAPVSSAPGDDSCVLTRILADLCAITPRPGQIIIASGDVMFGLAGHGIDLCGGDISVLALPRPFAEAARHGVFVCRQGRVVDALQKPTRAEVERASAWHPGRTLLVDSGVVCFTSVMAAGLLASARPLLPRLRRASIPQVDLYDHLMRAWLPRLTDHGYRKPYDDRGTWSDDLLEVRACVRRCVGGSTPRIACIVARDARFQHMGTTQQCLDLVCGASAKRAAQIHCTATKLHLSGNSLAVGIGVVSDQLRLPRGWSAFELPLLGGKGVRVVHGTDDDFKSSCGGGGTIAGEPLRSLFTRAGVDYSESDTLWDAPLWPVVSRDSARRSPQLLEGALAWMRRRGARPTAAWHAHPRLSLAELAARVDGPRLIEHAESAMSAQILKDLPIAVARDPDASPLAAHRRLRSPTQLKQLSRAYAAQVGRVQARAPLAAARLLLAIEDAAALQGAARIADLARTTAMSFVGEAVSAPFNARHPERGARTLHLTPGSWVEASAPVRVDFAGGWSDTPPICNETGGTVLNAAIRLDGDQPVTARVEVTDSGRIEIVSMDQQSISLIDTTAELSDHSDPLRWDALPRAALSISGLVRVDSRRSLGGQLAALGGGLRVTMSSGVPKGSGLGTSSILGATILAALDGVEELGGRGSRRLRTRADHATLIERTSALEQMIATRGGWQDQVGGLLPGVKIARTTPGREQRPRVQAIRLSSTTLQQLEKRCVLIDTGHTRMAKLLLETVEGGYLRRDPARIAAVHQLKAGAERAATALAQGNLDAFAECLSEYWKLKCIMDPNASPAFIQRLMGPLERHAAAWLLCGAGGGGFALVFAHNERSAARIRQSVRRPARAIPFSIDIDGLRIIGRRS